MQAILMAAGKGSRLGALASDRPKSFVEIEGTSLIDINVHMLKEFGIEDIIIVTGCHADKFEDKFRGKKGIKLVYNPFYGFTNVIGSFYMGMEELHDDFIYMHADTLCAPSILEDLIASRSEIAIPVDERPCDEEAMKVRSENGRVKAISKKLDIHDCDGEFIGVAKVAGSVLPGLMKNTRELLRQEKFSEYFEAALEKTILEQDCKVEIIDTGSRFWAEIDFLEDYQRACENIPSELFHF